LADPVSRGIVLRLGEGATHGTFWRTPGSSRIWMLAALVRLVGGLARTHPRVATVRDSPFESAIRNFADRRARPGAVIHPTSR
jgi:hypothetical protein